MNLVEIWVNDGPLDMYSDTDIRFTFQVNDIADVKDRQTNYTNSFNIPKTPNNIRIFKGLGISSDTSDIPYQKPNCRLKIQGYDLIVKGWLNVSETSEDYKCFVYSGIINFFKAIENKTLGDSFFKLETEHRKNTSNVIKSFSSNIFKYLIADYNGNTHFDKDNQKVINIDYLVPSISVKYLWDKIHSELGFRYSGEVFSSDDFTNLWLSYPKYISNEDFSEIKNTTSSNISNTSHLIWKDKFQLIVPEFEEHKKYIITEEATYRITLQVNNRTNKNVRVNLNELANARIYLSVNEENIPVVNRNGIEVVSFKIYQDTTQIETISKVFKVGDEISFYCDIESPYALDFNVNIKIEKNNTIIDIANELKDFQVKDFVKEVINRFGLTIFTDDFSNNIKYLTLKERLSVTKKINWSNKYINRISEKYINSFYAQKNNFRFQYNDKGADYNDASIIVRNENIAEGKDLFKSKIYSPEKDLTKDFYIGNIGRRNVDVFKFYEKEVDEEGGVKYKGLENRFYLIKEEILNSNISIGSVAFNEKRNVFSIPIGTSKNTDWSYYIKKYYYEFGKILNDFRIHSINLNLSLIDVLNIDFNAIYYFEQEQQYYLLNKLSFDGNKTSGEFIRVKQDKEEVTIIDLPPAPTDPINPEIEIKFVGEDSDQKIQTEDNVLININREVYDNNNPPVLKYWQVMTSNGFTNIEKVNSTSFHWRNLNVGVHSIRVRVVLKDGNEMFSNTLRLAKLSEPMLQAPREFSYWVDSQRGAYFVYIDKDKRIKIDNIEQDIYPSYNSNTLYEYRFLAYAVITADY